MALNNIDNLIQKKLNFFNEVDKTITQHKTNYTTLHSRNISEIRSRVNNQNPTIIKPLQDKDKHHQKFISLYKEAEKITQRKKDKIYQDEIKYKHDNFKPSINPQSKNIMRDPNSFHHRLHPNNSSKSFKRDINKTNGYDTYKLMRFYPNGSGRNTIDQGIDKGRISRNSNLCDASRHFNTSRNNISLKNKPYNNDLTFKPKISDNSKVIANLLKETSTERLLKPPRSKSRNKEDVYEKYSYNPSVQYFRSLNKMTYQETNQKSTISIKSDNNNKGIELYERGQVYLKNKIQTNEKKANFLKKQELDHPFRPALNSNTINILEASRSKSRNHSYDAASRILNKSSIYRSKREMKIKKIQNEMQEQHEKTHTFHPSIYKPNLKEDKRIIEMNLKTINSYVHDRRQFLKKKSESKENQPRRKYILPESKQIIQDYKEFNTIKQDEKYIDYSLNNFVYKPSKGSKPRTKSRNISTNSIDSINRSRKEYATNDFFNTIDYSSTNTRIPIVNSKEKQPKEEKPDDQAGKKVLSALNDLKKNLVVWN